MADTQELVERMLAKEIPVALLSICSHVLDHSFSMMDFLEILDLDDAKCCLCDDLESPSLSSLF